MTTHNVPPAIAIHGGAGNLDKYKGTSRIKDAEQELSLILDNATDMAHGGMSALDIVTESVIRLENSGLFHAGKGSSPSSSGVVEMDASIMSGTTLQAGAVISVSSIKNPIILARYIMEHTPQVILVGAQAAKLAEQAGALIVDQNYFVPCDEIGAALNTSETAQGTVGAVARDSKGHMAAATSTGGVLRKMAGRVGDSPIIGAGTYAQDGVGAVSCTGVGEYFIRVSAAHQIISRIELLAETAGSASGVVMDKIVALGGTGGVIVIGQRGEIAMPFSTPGMYRAAIDAKGKRIVAIF